MTSDLSEGCIEFAIGLDVASFERGIDPITGVVFIRCGDIIFPEGSWSDFPVVILGWWHRGAVSLVEGSRQEKFLFMDGPYWFEVLAEDPIAWGIRFGRDKRTLGEYNVVGRQFVGEILSAGNVIIRACMERKWSSADIRGLSTGRSLLQRALKKRDSADGTR